VALQLGGWVGRLKTPYCKTSNLLRNVVESLGPGWILWHDQKVDKRFGMWNIMSLYRADSLETATELRKYKLDLMGIQEVKWEKGGTEWAEDYTFFYGEWDEDHQLGTSFFVHKGIILPVRRIEFLSDRCRI
jgi:hypothetical protein